MKMNRRSFLKTSSVLGAASTLSLPMRLMAAQPTSFNDYRALVCIFLYGGNDTFNTVIPFDMNSYNKYANLRQSVAVDRNRLWGTVLNPQQPLPNGEQLALHPNLGSIKPLFDQGKLAVVLNVGALVVPTSKWQYENRQVPLPPKLFSHNDQQSYWMSAAPEGAQTGWAGRMCEVVGSNSVFSKVSGSGNTVFLAGRNSGGYQVGTKGSTTIDGLQNVYNSGPARDALRSIITRHRSNNLLENEIVNITNRSIAADSQLSSAIGYYNPYSSINSLGDQLNTVARMIKARSSLGVGRQVFFVGLNGFDTHDNLNGTHPALLQKLGDAMATFYQQTVEMGIQDNVTSFTMSDFGRTITTNGDGSDHGWGSHHFVMGGAVAGGRFYGENPQLDLNGPNFVDGGRLLPTTSIDQYGGTLARWFGVDSEWLQMVFPSARNFGNSTLGFV